MEWKLLYKQLKKIEIMPPKKTFVFTNLSNESLQITIQAYSLEQAYYVLIDTVKHSADFKCTSL